MAAEWTTIVALALIDAGLSVVALGLFLLPFRAAMGPATGAVARTDLRACKFAIGTTFGFFLAMTCGLLSGDAQHEHMVY